MQFVLRNIKLGARIKGLYRQDIYEIPSVAIRELLINCTLHRSYLAGGNIQVAIFDDRLEVFCPGKLPLDQTIELMQKGVSRIRNEALAKAFSYMNLIEGWGSGIYKINTALKEAGLKEMEITGGDIFLRFTIYRNQDFNPIESGTVNDKNGTVNNDILSTKETVVVKQLQKNSSVTSQQLTQSTNIPLRTIKRILLRLCDKGVIQRIGSDKTGHWEVI